jgi:glycerophosphoryl diester phosphodiesterase
MESSKLVDAAPGVELIAHRAGNHAERVGPAAVVADTVEIDVHLFRGRLEVRHTKVLWPTSILWERWHLDRNAERPALDEILDEVPVGLGLWLDLKGFTPRLTRRVVRMLAERDQASQHALTASCRSWWALTPARRAGMRTLRSVGSRWQRWLAVRDRPCADGHVVNQALLDERIVTALRRRNPLVVAWGVDDVARAHVLIAWGVRGIIADDLGLLAELGTPPGPPA